MWIFSSTSVHKGPLEFFTVCSQLLAAQKCAVQQIGSATTNAPDLPFQGKKIMNKQKHGCLFWGIFFFLNQQSAFGFGTADPEPESLASLNSIQQHVGIWSFLRGSTICMCKLIGFLQIRMLVQRSCRKHQMPTMPSHWITWRYVPCSTLSSVSQFIYCQLFFILHLARLKKPIKVDKYFNL